MYKDDFISKIIAKHLKQEETRGKQKKDNTSPKVITQPETEKERLQRLYNGKDVVFMDDGKIMARREYLRVKYKHGAILTDDIYYRDEDAAGYIKIWQEELDWLNSELEKDRKSYEAMRLCAKLNNEGIALEKEGNIEEAIKVYEQNLSTPFYATHSYERLMILYRKKKDYLNERRVAELAVQRFPKEKKYKERLMKINAIIEQM